MAKPPSCRGKPLGCPTWLRNDRLVEQTEIGKELGVSQMHVSRLLARALATLREGLLIEA